MKVFNLPDLGEGLPDAEIVKWYVKTGDVVEVDQPLVAMETAKAVVDVPTPFSGEIGKLHGEPGDVIQTGSALVEFNVKDTATVAGVIEQGDTVIADETIQVVKKTVSKIKATPAIRALANKLQVNIDNITPSGANGVVTKQDVENAANADGYKPLRGVRRAMADAMVKSQQQVVPVTIYDDAVLLNWTQDTDLTVELMLAISYACSQEPQLNSWFNGATNSVKSFSEVNLGIAMDTDDGLFVPVIRDIGSKDAQQLRAELNDLKRQVSDRIIEQERLSGSTIVLSNFGKFAGRYATPIVVPPTVVIIGAGKLRDEMVVVDGESRISKVLPLSLTFDHRACTGGEASRFISYLLKKIN